MSWLLDFVFSLILIPFDVAAARRLREADLEKALASIGAGDPRAVYFVLRAFDPLGIAALPDADSLYEDLARRANATLSVDALHDTDAAARRLESLAHELSSDVCITANHSRMRSAVRRIARFADASS